MSVAALVLAAGRGARLRHDVPKAFVPLLGRPILVHAIERVAACGEVDMLLPVVAAADLPRFARLGTVLAGVSGLRPPVRGGSERQDSVRAGLAALEPDVEWVIVHDAARALLRPEAVTRALAGARETGAALLALPARDTLKRVEDGRVLETPDRSVWWVAQTPQVFRRELLREALDKAEADGVRGTDDAQLVERLGVTVRVVPGDADNLKITGPEDLLVAEALLCARERGA